MSKRSKQKVYISGKITGVRLADAKQQFARYEGVLIHDGYEPVNPFHVSEYHPDKTWEDYMKDDIKALCDCDEIHMLPGFETSKGAMLEMQIASRLGLIIKIV